jgi:ribonuclease E
VPSGVDLDAAAVRRETLPALFDAYDVTDQLRRAMGRKVWLPSGGYLIIETTEAMKVIDVNTGKFTGGADTNLEEVVLKTNLEAAEEIVRQLRLRDMGGIIVIDFIDMLLKANQDQVVRRLKRELLRDRTKTRVSEVSRLGLVQMTRKNVSQGLIESFSHPCEVCDGRGIVSELA